MQHYVYDPKERESAHNMIPSTEHLLETTRHLISGNNLLIGSLLTFNDGNLQIASDDAEEAQRHFGMAIDLGKEGLEELVSAAKRGSLTSLIVQAEIDYKQGILLYRRDTLQASQEILLTDAVQKYVQANKAFDELRTYSLDHPDLSGSNWIEEDALLGPVDRPDEEKNILDRMISGKVFPHMLDAVFRVAESKYDGGRRLLSGKARGETPDNAELREGIQHFKNALPWYRSFLEFYGEAEEKGVQVDDAAKKMVEDKISLITTYILLIEPELQAMQP